MRFKIIKEFFKIDLKYKESIYTYKQIDGFLAITLFIVTMIVYYLTGIIYAEKTLYFGIQSNLFLVLLCVACVLARKQKMSSIGFGKENIGKSLIFGVVTASIILLAKFIPGIIEGNQFSPVVYLSSKFVYFLIAIALVEEILFRGFIQTRIYGVLKNSLIAILTTSFMFMLLHIPFQMGKVHMGFIS